MQWGNKIDIFNVKNKLGEKTNELGYHKNNKKNKRYNMNRTLIWIRSTKFLKINTLLKHHWKNTKEKERVRMGHKYSEILSNSSSSSSSDESLETSPNDSSDSGTRQEPIKPVTSFNKSSTFWANRKSDNEKTPLKQPHWHTSASKQEILEKSSVYIKRVASLILNIYSCFLLTA